MSGDVDPAAVVEMLDDECARTVLTETSQEPMSATELADVCDVSLPTVYRRVERLAELDLLRERTRPRSDGHHDDVYVASFDRFEVQLEDGEFEFALERAEPDPADELAKLWERF